MRIGAVEGETGLRLAPSVMHATSVFRVSTFPEKLASGDVGTVGLRFHQGWLWMHPAAIFETDGCCVRAALKSGQVGRSSAGSVCVGVWARVHAQCTYSS
jgi:hypothetical protein